MQSRLPVSFCSVLLVWASSNKCNCKAVAHSNWRQKEARQRCFSVLFVSLRHCPYFTFPIIMSFRKPCHMPFRKLLLPSPVSFLRRISTASETDETLTRLTQSTHVPRVHVSYAISFMSYHVSDLEKFPVSQKVMLFFFYFIFFLLLLLSRVRPFVFWLFWRIKFCFKPRRTLNGSQETLLGSFLWLAVCSNK